MLKIYIAHSIDFDFKNELYTPIRNSHLNSQHEFILPHETNQFINSKVPISNSSLIIAEVSYPSIGLGIELGWADNFNIPIICLHKNGIKPASSLKAITETIVPYFNSTDMVTKIDRFLSVNDF